MTSGTASDFREAARHERELNERQREILRLVEAGHTNREIADMLGLSVDGAKWNVSEILTKLGLESREQAADYWRWRHGSVRSRVRGWLGAPLLKVAGAGAATVLGIGVVAALSSEDEAPLEAEWVLEGEFYNRREGGNFLLEPPEQADRGTMRWVWVDGSHWRWEVDYSTDRNGTQDAFAVADGEFLHFYEGGASNWHYRARIDALPDGFLQMLGSSAPGPFNRITSDSIDAYVEGRNSGHAFEDWIVQETRRAGTDVVLGFSVEIVESTPSWVNGAARTFGGVHRQWIEPTHGVVVKSTSEGNDGSEQSAATATVLKFDAVIDPDELRFRAPSGSCDLGENMPYPHPDSGKTHEEFIRETCGR